MEKLTKIQRELKAPKNQYNSFGKYNYRSCEDILEGLKPCLDKYNCTVTLSDDIVLIGDRYYVKATATITDNETGATESTTALAREAAAKKGMDDSQVTGTASSYARKYALNGLFLIDDTKDADTDENRNESQGRAKTQAKKQQSKKPEEREFDPSADPRINYINAVKSLFNQGKISEQATINAFQRKNPAIKSVDQLSENQLRWILSEDNWKYLK